ncbi:adenosylcobinamide-GDP ribazoletransferase [Prochlorococcus sp. MIT 0602]|uniref:adenosylcobinamide-GDP ribazoletransferase n=1 Tax=Prochlorococcus sp. MIT 0602 TaxID=1499499 RepID=UPI000567D9C5|nr:MULTISPECIES: adenosylcobinamide-GDP ribazoletransferase [unclassified Prochlorococcus]
MNSPNWLKELSGAWTFYTVLPQWPVIKPRFQRIARFAPCIGLGIGVLQALLIASLSFSKWPDLSLPFISIAFGLWVTGGIHLDGLMDTADGISAGQQRCYEAMKDSRVGASAIIALSINIFLQIAALIKLKSLCIVAIPLAYFWGRYSQIIAIGNYPSIQKSVSSKFHKNKWKGTLKESIPSIVCILIMLSAIHNLNIINSFKLHLIIGTFTGLAPAIAIPRFLANKLGGHSGDSYGACVVLVETLTLLMLAIILPAN